MLTFNSKAVAEHSEVPLADDGELEKLIERSSDRDAAPTPADVCFSYPRATPVG